jgi:hypothetical protein
VTSVSAPVLADVVLLDALCSSSSDSRIGAPRQRLAPMIVEAAAALA